MKVLPYRIRLHQPVLAATLGGDPNNVLGLDYLPGSTLRGMLVKRYAGGTTLDAADPNLRRLFFDHGVRFLNAYPAGFNDRRCLPIPLSWHHRKHDPAKALDFAVNPPQTVAIQYESIHAPFFAPEVEDEEAIAHVVTPEREQSVHTTRDRRAGRALGSGDIYAYEALAPGQSFRAAILCDQGTDADTLRTLLGGRGRVGGARTAYGAIELEPEQPVDGLSWRELASDDAEPEADDLELLVTLLSDTLLRDARGTLCTDAGVLRTALEQRLNVKLEEKQVYLGAQLTGGFNNTWSLPLPQSAALCMGSVFVFRIVSGQIKASQLQNLEWTGVGERRAEGFGRVLINWHPRESWDILPLPGPGQQGVGAVTSHAGLTMARRMASRIFSARMEHALNGTALNTSTNQYQIDRAPPPSQLSRLRQVVQEELLKSTPSPNCIETFLDGLKRTATEHFTRARIAGETLDQWLRTLAHGLNDAQWQAHFNLKARDIPRVGSVAAQLDNATRDRYLLRFVDLVLARAIKEARKRGSA